MPSFTPISFAPLFKRFGISLFGAFCLLGHNAFAGDANLNAVRARFESATGAKVKNFVKAPAGDLYEVLVDGKIYYTDASGRYLITGSLTDLKTKTNLTEERLAVINRVDLASFPSTGFIKSVSGDGMRQLIVFADPNCGYCKRLTPELDKLNNVIVKVFPVAILGSDSLIKSQAALCASDPVATWAALLGPGNVSYGVTPQCNSLPAVDKNTKLMASLGISGTPAIIFPDGSRLPGYADAKTIESKLQSIAQAKQTTR